MTTHPEAAAALEDCPVCGHNKAFTCKEYVGPMTGLSYVKCQACNWRSCYADTPDVAEKEWNVRSRARFKSAAHPETPAEAQGRDDMVLAPRYPTPKMIKAYLNAMNTMGIVPGTQRKFAQHLKCTHRWRAMIAAAPSQRTEGG